jgi:hypothetical protein
MIAVKGPALGISPQNYTSLLGRIAERTIEMDEPFLDSDLGIKVTLDTEHALPMQYGFTVRFRDYEDLLKYKPQLLEFHFTDQDLDDPYPGGDLDLMLVVHAPEFWERTLVDLCSTDERVRIDSRDLMQKTIDMTRKMAPHFKKPPQRRSSTQAV